MENPIEESLRCRIWSVNQQTAGEDEKIHENS